MLLLGRSASVAKPARQNISTHSKQTKLRHRPQVPLQSFTQAVLLDLISRKRRSHLQGCLRSPRAIAGGPNLNPRQWTARMIQRMKSLCSPCLRSRSLLRPWEARTVAANSKLVTFWQSLHKGMLQQKLLLLPLRSLVNPNLVKANPPHCLLPTQVCLLSAENTTAEQGAAKSMCLFSDLVPINICALSVTGKNNAPESSEPSRGLTGLVSMISNQSRQPSEPSGGLTGLVSMISSSSRKSSEPSGRLTGLFSILSNSSKQSSEPSRRLTGRVATTSNSSRQSSEPSGRLTGPVSTTSNPSRQSASCRPPQHPSSHHGPDRNQTQQACPLQETQLSRAEAPFRDAAKTGVASFAYSDAGFVTFPFRWVGSARNTVSSVASVQ